jgi:hypothetical protein
LASESGDDAELVALAKRMVALQQLEKEAAALCVRLYEEYEASAPQRPEVLRWMPGDPAGPMETKEDKGRWCHPFWVERLRGVEQRRYWFVGADKEARTIKGTEFDWMGRPDKTIAHLYRSELDPRLQKRADEILAAQDAFDAASNAALNATGYPAASDVLSVITTEMDEILDRVEKLEPSTLEGFRSLAITLLYHYTMQGKIEAKPDSIDDLDQKMTWKLLSSLTGIPVSVPASV